jgi:hypothetical protein
MMTRIDSHLQAAADADPPRIAWMADFRRTVRGRLLLDGLARVAAAAVSLLFVTFLLDRAFRLSPAARLVVLVTCAGALLVILWREIAVPLRLKLDSLTLAAALDRALIAGGSVTAQVGSVMGLPSLLHGPTPPSAAMVREAVARSSSALGKVNYRPRLNNRRRNASATLMASAIVLPAIVAIAAPSTVRLWAARAFLGSREPWPQSTYLQIAGLTGGELVVPRGEPFVLRVSARDGSIVPDRVSVRLRQGSQTRVNANLTAFGPNDFRYDSGGIQEPSTIELWGGDDSFGPILIRAADRPKIASLTLITQHPTESKPRSHAFNGEDADLMFLPKTRMRLRFAANTPIAIARVTSSTTQPSQADLRRIDDSHFEMGWVQEAEVHLQIDLTSRDAQLASNPTAVAIGVKTDRPPRVTLGYAGIRQRVTARARIPLTVDTIDDYGVARVDLSLKVETPDPANPTQMEGTEHSVGLFGPANPADELRVQRQQTVELEPMKLPVGSLLTISASATDACYTGPQTSRSRQVAFRVVSPEELFREILLKQQAERAKFRKQTDEARAIRDQLPTLGKGGAAGEIARRFRAVQREAAAVNTALSDSVTEMRLNALATDQAYELIESTVLSPLKSLNDGLMGPQKDALNQLAATSSSASQDVGDRQDKIVEQMEAILKQMSQWDSFVDVLNQLNEIIRLQGQAQQQTDQLKKQQTEGVFSK